MEEERAFASSGKHGRVLVVDDVAAVRKSITLTLTGVGYDVVTAEDGEEAIHLLQAESMMVDAVLCDLQMPNMNGTEAIRHIRRHHPAIPVVALTAYADVQAAIALMRQGVLDFLVKPVLPDELLLVVQRAVEQNAMRKEPTC